MVNKDVIIAQLLEQNQLLAEHNIQLQQKVQMLEEKIARLEKNSSNSSKPPSSDIINPQPTNKKKTKRKIGGQKGHPKHSRPLFEADEIDNTIIHELSAKEIKRKRLITLPETESALQQIDLPKKLYYVIDHRVQLYLAPNGNIIKAKLPKDIRKAGLFSTRTMA